MDFLKKLLAASEDSGSEDENEAIFEDALRAGKEATGMLIAASKKYAGQESYFEAALFLFVAAWSVVGYMANGVQHSIKNHGLKSPVARVWHLIRVAIGGGETNMDKAMVRIATFDKDWEEGKFTDVV